LANYSISQTIRYRKLFDGKLANYLGFPIEKALRGKLDFLFEKALRVGWFMIMAAPCIP